MSPCSLPPGNLEGVAVEPRAGEPVERLVRRFARLVDHSGVLADLRRRRWFRTRREIGHLKRRLATRRQTRRREAGS